MPKRVLLYFQVRWSTFQIYCKQAGQIDSFERKQMLHVLRQIYFGSVFLWDKECSAYVVIRLYQIDFGTIFRRYDARFVYIVSKPCYSFENFVKHTTFMRGVYNLKWNHRIRWTLLTLRYVIKNKSRPFKLSTRVDSLPILSRYIFRIFLASPQNISVAIILLMRMIFFI